MLKLRFLPQSESKDFILFKTDIFLDDTTELREDEMEICRFKLKAGSRLRQDYVDFHDLNTEFDTLNILHVPYAGMDLPTIAPYVTRYFAKEAYPLTVGNPLTTLLPGCASTAGRLLYSFIAGYPVPACII